MAAIVLTLGTTNAYINGAASLAGQLIPAVTGRGRPAPTFRLLAAVAASGLVLITLYGLRIVSAAALVAAPTALFLAVYLGAMVAAARILRSPARLAALPTALAVTVMLGFCGWAVTLPAVVALAVGWRARARLRDPLRARGRFGPDKQEWHRTTDGVGAIIALRCAEASSQREAICNTLHTQTRTA